MDGWRSGGSGRGEQQARWCLLRSAARGWRRAETSEVGSLLLMLPLHALLLHPLLMLMPPRAGQAGLESATRSDARARRSLSHSPSVPSRVSCALHGRQSPPCREAEQLEALKASHCCDCLTSAPPPPPHPQPHPRPHPHPPSHPPSIPVRPHVAEVHRRQRGTRRRVNLMSPN